MKDFTLTPLGERVIIERHETEDKTTGGVYIPDTVKGKAQTGTVRAVGPGRELDNGEMSDMRLNEGDEVLFAAFAGTEVQVSGATEQLLCLEISEILAIITTPKKRTK